MLDALAQALAPPVLERLTLVLNHVLRSEPVALARLAPHAGRELSVELGSWPALLPPAPPMRWRITPAGMLEWCAVAAAAAPDATAEAARRAGTTGDVPPAAGAGQDGTDLRVVVDAGNPAALLARALAGERPAVQVEGDAAFAADVGWLLQNLRWDVAADLERFFGPAVAGQLHQLGRAFAGGLRAALDSFAGVASKTRVGPGAGKTASEVASQVAEKVTQLASRFGPGRR